MTDPVTISHRHLHFDTVAEWEAYQRTLLAIADTRGLVFTCNVIVCEEPTPGGLPWLPEFGKVILEVRTND